MSSPDMKKRFLERENRGRQSEKKREGMRKRRKKSERERGDWGESRT